MYKYVYIYVYVVVIISIITTPVTIVVIITYGPTSSNSKRSEAPSVGFEPEAIQRAVHDQRDDDSQKDLTSH